MVKWLVKRYLKKALRKLLNSYKPKVIGFVSAVDMYELKLMEILRYLDSLKSKFADGELDDREFDEVFADGERLIDSCFQNER